MHTSLHKHLVHASSKPTVHVETLPKLHKTHLQTLKLYRNKRFNLKPNHNRKWPKWLKLNVLFEIISYTSCIKEVSRWGADSEVFGRRFWRGNCVVAAHGFRDEVALIEGQGQGYYCVWRDWVAAVLWPRGFVVQETHLLAEYRLIRRHKKPRQSSQHRLDKEPRIHAVFRMRASIRHPATNTIPTERPKLTKRWDKVQNNAKNRNKLKSNKITIQIPDLSTWLFQQ